MNRRQFRIYKRQFVRALRNVISERGNEAQIVEAGFCAYADPNPLIRLLFWRRLWVAISFLKSHGQYEAVLDFGCGGGVALPLLTDLANRVVAVDLNLTPYRLLSAHIPFPSEPEVYETKAHPLSRFPDKTFDAVISLDVLEHVSDLEDVIAQLCRITKPGGMLVVSGPTENLFYRIGRKIAGKEYTGDYHVRNVYDIHRAVALFMKTKTLATLYYPFPLFRIFMGRIAV